jgi:tetratricopeptide (TPR) repeat protein
MDSEERKLPRWALVGISVLLAFGYLTFALSRHRGPNSPSPVEPSSPERNPAPLAIAATQSVFTSTSTNQRVETGEDRVVVLVTEGNELLARGDYAEAAGKYQQALAITPGEEDLHYNLAIALAKLGKTEEAKTQYAEALEIYPEYSDAHNNLGNLLMNENKLDEAIEHFREATRVMPENASFHNNLGTAFGRQGKTSEAIAEFQEAVKRRPAYLEARVNLANAYLAAGRVEEAIPQINEALRLQPNFEPALRAMQRARQKQAFNRAPQ